jgi:acyl-CoA synthetase (NDP forming)/GNAT superfamily N-acetyltransferase
VATVSTEQTRPGGVDVLTADGGIVRIRPVAASDAPALATLYSRSSPSSLRMRFFAVPGPRAIADEVARLCRPPDADHAALLAEQAGTVLGVASYERMPADARRAEFAVFVAEAHHGRGIGTLLLEHLAPLARQHGLTELVGEVMPGNAAMLRVASDLSGHVWSRLDDGLVDVGIATAGSAEVQAAVEIRERVAERASLRPLLAPRVVAVVGAGRAPGGVGHETLKAIVEYGFTGTVYAVNPHATVVAGVPAYPRLSDVPDPVDLAVVAVPAPAVPGVLADAGAAGVRAAVVLSCGFEATDADGRAARARLVRLARAHGIRLVGPNCLGVLNTDPKVRLAATFAPVLPRAALPSAGGLAVASQSGAVGIAVLDHAARAHCGISSFVSMGDKLDVSGNDLLAYWFDDPTTQAVALYLESFGNPRKFARMVRALARRKPVLAVFSGRSPAGQRAGASHTAAAAAPAATVDALFAQAGVIRTNHLGELLDTARMVTGQPLPGGNRLAILGNAGGVNVLAADAAAAAGLVVPEASARLRQAVAQKLPTAAGTGNPVDLGPGAPPAAFARALDLLASSGEADAVLVVAAATRVTDIGATLTALGAAADRWDTVPVAVVVLGSPGGPTTVGSRRAPVFDLPEQAVRALGHAAGYAAWLREPLGSRPELSGVDTAAARAVVDRVLARSTDVAISDGWQPYENVCRILSAYGIPMVSGSTAAGEDEAVAAAERLGYPVAVKAADPALVHKSDVGGVRLGLADAGAVRAAYRAVAAVDGPDVLVQAMATGPGRGAAAGDRTVELIAGVVHDKLFGSLVMLGAGGVHTELFGDRTLRLVPVTDLDAGRMWRSLRAAPLLTGYRGSPPVDTAAVEDLVLRLGRLAEELPEVAELDLNPVLAGPGGVIAVDVKLRLAAVDAEPDAWLRALREPA